MRVTDTASREFRVSGSAVGVKSASSSRVIETFPGASESGHGEDYRIELLKIPQLGEIKTNRRRPMQAALFYLLDDPGNAVIQGRFSFRHIPMQNLNCQDPLLKPPATA